LQRKKTYVFSEIEDYRELLEIKHLRTKNNFVLSIISLMMVISVLYMFLAEFPLKQTITILVGFLLVISSNIVELAYGREDSHFYKLNIYITTLGIFSLTIGMIFLFQSPSTITALFIAYAISAFYQDLKVLILSNLLLLFTVIMIMLHFPEFLDFQNATLENQFGVAFFFLSFITILTISSYIIVKQKRFFYNQIALSKETEFRNIDLLIDLRKQVMGETLNIEEYYKKTASFIDAFCIKIETENVFKEKLKILEALEKKTPVSVLIEQFPNYSKEDFFRLEALLISNHFKLRKVAIKISHILDLDIKKREIFSETHFKSFNHQSDNFEIKIIGFVLFYAALKKGSTAMPGLSEDKIYDILINTDYYYYIDPRIIKVYKDNSEVFDEIVKDAFGKKAN